MITTNRNRMTLRISRTAKVATVAELAIRGEGGERVTVSIPERERDARSEGWVAAEVSVKLGAWSGHYSANFHEDDLRGFANQLTRLGETLAGEATLSSLDGYLDVTLTGDGLGHFTVAGEAWDRPRWASHLVVSNEIDQTALPALLTSLASVVAYLDRFG